MKLAANLDVSGNKLKNGELEYELPSSSGTIAITSNLPTDYAKEEQVKTGSGASEKTAIGELTDQTHGLSAIEQKIQDTFLKFDYTETMVLVAAVNTSGTYYGGSLSNDTFVLSEGAQPSTTPENYQVGNVVKYTGTNTGVIVSGLSDDATVTPDGEGNYTLSGVVSYISLVSGHYYQVKNIVQVVAGLDVFVYEELPNSIALSLGDLSAVLDEIQSGAMPVIEDGLAKQGNNPFATNSALYVKLAQVISTLGIIRTETEIMSLPNSAKIDIVTPEEHSGAISDFPVEANVMYQFGDLTSLSLVMQEPDDLTIYNEFVVSFFCQSGFTLQIQHWNPNTEVLFASGARCDAGHYYMLSVVDNLAYLGKF